jgi:hypothetical protein
LPATYFHGRTDPTNPVAQARYYLRGVVHLTMNQPPELQYKIIFRNIATGVDDLCFGGIQVGGCGSRHGVMGVSGGVSRVSALVQETVIFLVRCYCSDKTRGVP